MRAFFRCLSALFLLAAFSLLSPLASADVFTVGPLYVNGSGNFSTEDRNQDGEVPGITFFATGSNGVDSVSFGGDVDTEGTPQDFLALVENPATTVGSTFSFGGGGSVGCFNGDGTGINTCSANIDGITGVPEFIGIGGDLGLVQVYQHDNFTPNTSIGPLLAQAYVITTNVITNVTYLGGAGRSDPVVCVLVCYGDA